MRSAYDVVTDLVESNKNIKSIRLVSYDEKSTWRDLVVPGEHIELPVLVQGLNQDQGPRVFNDIPREQATADELRVIASNLSESRVLGICSIVQLVSGESLHIPMMDFLCTPSQTNLTLLTNLVGKLDQRRGFLLESGRSYHYYGFDLLSTTDWQAFLGKCLLMSGFADDRYIGHQLVDGHCVLRLSSGKLKSCVPVVVAELPSRL